jgi:hypothetical protein
MAKEKEIIDQSEDVLKLQKALLNERNDHKATTAMLKAAQTRITKSAALGPAPSPVVVSQYIADGVRAGVAHATAELQQKIGTLETQLSAANAATADINGKLVTRTIAEEVRQAARESHVLPSAVNDLLSLGNLELKFVDGKVQTDDGRDVATWLDQSKATRPYMWPTARGSGARGSGDGGLVVEGDNPFKAGPSFNLTKQRQLAMADPARAARLQTEAAAMARQ